MLVHNPDSDRTFMKSLLAVVIVITLDVVLSLSLFHSIVLSYCYRSSLSSLCSSSIYVRVKDILNSDSSFSIK